MINTRKRLTCELQGIMLADISEEEGKEAVCKLEECGDGEVQFLKTDVSVPQQLKSSFRRNFSQRIQHCMFQMPLMPQYRVLTKWIY